MTFFSHRKGLEIGSKLPNTSELYGSVSSYLCILVCFSCTLQKTMTWQWRLLRPEPNKLSHFTHWSDSKIRDVLTAEKNKTQTNKPAQSSYLNLNSTLLTFRLISVSIYLPLACTPVERLSHLIKPHFKYQQSYVDTI